MNRRGFLIGIGKSLLGCTAPAALGSTGDAPRRVPPSDAAARDMPQTVDHPKPATDRVTLSLCGDVMTGRGIDQALPFPSDPRIHESYVRSAVDYLRLAESANGPITRPVDFAYIWGDALAELERGSPDLRIINLETSVTTSDDYWPGKGIHYRMHPRNIACLSAARIDCCALANNHVLDWGYDGLAETLETLTNAGLQHAGAGLRAIEAEAPVVLPIAGKGRVVMVSCGTGSSGIPPEWAADQRKPGVNRLPDLSARTVERIATQIEAIRRPGDFVVMSIHWGGNWGHDVPEQHRRFAHRLIDNAGVDVVHGHSSHHPRPIEVYRGRLILYGCGDLLNDYEGISGYEHFRGDLGLLYFVSLEPGARTLAHLELVPMQTKRFRLNRAAATDAEWLMDVLNRVGEPFGTRVALDANGRYVLRWDER